jgi:hypothetical protein
MVEDVKQVDVRPKLAKVARIVEKPIRQAVYIVEHIVRRRRYAHLGKTSEAAPHGRANARDFEVRFMIPLQVLEKHVGY